MQTVQRPCRQRRRLRSRDVFMRIRLLVVTADTNCTGALAITHHKKAFLEASCSVLFAPIRPFLTSVCLSLQDMRYQLALALVTEPFYSLLTAELL